MAKISTMILVVISLFLCQKAEAFRCRGYLISPRDNMDKVLKYCGEPATRSERNKVIIHRYLATLTETRDYIPYEYWVYDRGPHEFVRYLVFRYNTLEEIRTGDYGGREYPQLQFCQTSASGYYGASELEITNRCGAPSWQVHIQERLVPDGRGLDYETYSVVSVDEWTYDFGSSSARSTFRFEDGVLRQVANVLPY